MGHAIMAVLIIAVVMAIVGFDADEINLSEAHAAPGLEHLG